MLLGCWEEGDFCRVHKKPGGSFPPGSRAGMSEQLCETAGSIVRGFVQWWNQKTTWLPFPEQKVDWSGLHSGESWEERFCWRKIKQHPE